MVFLTKDGCCRDSILHLPGFVNAMPHDNGNTKTYENAATILLQHKKNSVLVFMKRVLFTPDH